jgi:DNA-binding NtrC family response regulator
MGNGADKPTILIVDDERNFTESLKLAIEDVYTVSDAARLGQAREILQKGIPDAILLDVRLPDGEGIELLRELKESGRMPVVIIMTAHGTVENAVNALKEGAVDFFTKPLDIDKLRRELAVYLENRTLQKKIIVLDREIKKVVPPFVTSGKGPMKEIVDRVRMVAPLAIPILLQGETGTGKEKLAQWIHQLSGLSGELVSLSCANMPKDIFESELFGYAKGAFSGASAMKEGFIEKAEGGTLFLDEIGELSDETQAKLLRVLDTGVYFKLGDTRERKAKFRLITATNKDLGNSASSFRRDLYYRINGIIIELPRLRDRREDIPLLAQAFLKEAGYAYNKNVKEISEQAMSILTRYDWPGNIRELKWFIHRAVATATASVLDVDDFSMLSNVVQKNAVDKATQETHATLKEAVEDMEKRLIMNALASAGDNKTDAAKILGISVRQLHYKIKQYSL